MSADAIDETTTTPPPAAPTYQELAQELFELGKQFPPPELEDIRADARWYTANEAALYKQYLGEHVAILNGALVGHGWNELQLTLDVARKYNVHPDRILTVYLFSIFEC